MSQKMAQTSLPRGVESLKQRIETLEKELYSLIQTSTERRVILRLLPVLNQALTRYVDEKIQCSIRKDRILQVFEPTLAQLNETDTDNRNIYHLLTRLQDHFIQAVDRNGDQEALIDRLELVQLKAQKDPELAKCLKELLGHHTIYNLLVEFGLTNYVEPEFLPFQSDNV